MDKELDPQKISFVIDLKPAFDNKRSKMLSMLVLWQVANEPTVWDVSAYLNLAAALREDAAAGIGFADAIQAWIDNSKPPQNLNDNEPHTD